MNMTAYDLYEVDTSTGAALVCQDHASKGERRRDTALALLAIRRAVYVRRAQRALLSAALDAGSATADDVAAVVDLPQDIDGRLLGAAPGGLVREGLLTLAGYVRSKRPERHASVIAVWRPADRLAALRWLDENPPLSELKTARQLELKFNEEPATVAAAAGSRFLRLSNPDRKDSRHG